MAGSLSISAAIGSTVDVTIKWPIPTGGYVDFAGCSSRAVVAGLFDLQVGSGIQVVSDGLRLLVNPNEWPDSSSPGSYSWDWSVTLSGGPTVVLVEGKWKVTEALSLG